MTSRTSKLARRLSAIQSECPRRLRLQVIELLRQAVPSEFGLFFRCIEPKKRKFYFTSPVSAGDEDLCKKSRQLADRQAPDTPWLPPNLDVDHVDRFVRVRNVYDKKRLQNFQLFKEVMVPLQVRDQIRILLHEDNQFLGWLGLMRPRRSQRYQRHDQQLLNEVRTEVKAAVSRADARESRVIEGGLFAVMKPDGELEQASPRFGRWDNERRRRYLTRRIRDVDDGASRWDSEIFDGTEVRVIRLDSEKRQRYLVAVKRARGFRIDPGFWLTARQREIARLAVGGATSPEIAEALGLSPQTVKTHMRNIFRRLKVNSRAELATLFRSARSTSAVC